MNHGNECQGIASKGRAVRTRMDQVTAAHISQRARGSHRVLQTATIVNANPIPPNTRPVIRRPASSSISPAASTGAGSSIVNNL